MPVCFDQTTVIALLDRPWYPLVPLPVQQNGNESHRNNEESRYVDYVHEMSQPNYPYLSKCHRSIMSRNLGLNISDLYF